MKIAFTGGHHTSALPVIKELRARHPNWELVWFGNTQSLIYNTRKELEYLEITSLNIPYYELNAGKFYKTYNLKRLLSIPLGFFQALRWLLILKPNVIMSFGGYIAVPVVLAGFILNIPTITHEQTTVVGYANRLISFFAKKVLVSFESSLVYFPKKKTKVVGLPLRDEVFRVSTTLFDLTSGLPMLYVTAGKTGSHLINELININLERLLQNYNIVHQTGDYSVFDDFSRLVAQYSLVKNKVRGKYYPRKFILNNEIGEVYAKADLVICRAGAHTVYELLHLAKPCLLIPISWVSHNEQYKNAIVLKSAGLGEVLDERDLTAEKFVLAVDTMFDNLKSYTLGSHQMPAALNSAQLIVNEIENS